MARDLRELDLSKDFEEFRLGRRRKVKRLNMPIEEEKKKTPKQVELEERREKVFEMMLRGYSNKQMAEELGVSLATIKVDAHAVKKQNADLVNEHEEKEFIGVVTRVFNRLMKHAWDDYESCREDYVRANFLNLMRLINKDVINLFIDMGLIGKNKNIAGDQNKLPPIDIGNLPVEIQVHIQNILTQYLISGNLKSELKEPELNPIIKSPKAIGVEKNE